MIWSLECLGQVCWGRGRPSLLSVGTLGFPHSRLQRQAWTVAQAENPHMTWAERHTPQTADIPHNAHRKLPLRAAERGSPVEVAAVRIHIPAAAAWCVVELRVGLAVAGTGLRSGERRCRDRRS